MSELSCETVDIVETKEKNYFTEAMQVSKQFRSVLQLEQALRELKQARHFLNRHRKKLAEKEIVDSLTFLGRALRTIQEEFGVAVATFNNTGGLQTFTAPADGFMSIQAIGAAGGPARGDQNSRPGSTFPPGRGASIKGSFTVTGGQTFAILAGGAGQGGLTNNGGGGGGSFVWIGTQFSDLTPATLLIAAGGGGGAASFDLAGNEGPGLDAAATPNGTPDFNGGSNGNGGGAGASNIAHHFGGAGGGAGVFSNGGSGDPQENGGGGGTAINAFSNAGSGGGPGPGGSFGGFGGGGGGGGNSSAGGGGGGYSGGGGGAYDGPGGGGGSFNSGISQANIAGVGTGNGTVTITFVPCKITLSITPQSSVFNYTLQGTVTCSGVPVQEASVFLTPLVPANIIPNPATTDASGNYATTMTAFVTGSITVEAFTVINGVTVITRQTIQVP